MPTPQHKILKQLGESTAYSSKNHFKAADVRRRTTMIMIVINIVVSVITLTSLIEMDLIIQLISAASLAASIYLLTLESRDGQNNPEKQMTFGNKYLSLHNELYNLCQQESPNHKEVDAIQKRVNELNETPRPYINFIARKLCKKAIEKNSEMNIWWK